MTQPTPAPATDPAATDPAAVEGGFDAVLGLAFDVLTGDEVRARWTVTPALLQPFGIVHGGVHCAVVEAVASRAALAWRAGAGGVVGVSNSTDFLRAVTEGELHAVGTPVHRGRSQQLWQVVITDDRDRLVARGQVRLQNLHA